MRRNSASTKKIVPFSIILQLKQLDPQSAQSVESVKTLYVMKSRPLKEDLGNSLLKSKTLDGEQRGDMFQEVRPRSQTHPQTSNQLLFFQERRHSAVSSSQRDSESVKNN